MIRLLAAAVVSSASPATRGPGVGARYRINVIGPGVTPDVSAEIDGLHRYDAGNPDDVAYESQQDALRRELVGGDKLCRQR